MKKYFALVFCGLLLPQLHAQIKTTINSSAKTVMTKGGADYYRVVAKGFICNRETNDDMLERDGKRDEIYLASTSVLIDANGYSMPQTSVKNRTRTMGDVNGRAKEERRCMAGSAVGSLGGIQTGDNVPDVEPWKNNANASGDLLPFVLWEGDLSDGKSVMITPTIMEYDGPDDFLTNLWHNSFVGQIAKIPMTFAQLPFALLTTGINTSNSIGQYDDSSPGVFAVPTAIQQFPYQFYRFNIESFTPLQRTQFLKDFAVVTNQPADRPIGSFDGSFQPLIMKFDATIIAQISQKDFGYGRGIVPIRFKDVSDLKGDYTVFYSFEKVTDESQKNRVNIVNNDVFDPLVGYQLRNVYADDKVADVLNGGMVNNTHIVLNSDKDIDSQKFRIKKANDYYFTFTNIYNNFNLDLLNKNDGNGSNIVTSTPDGSVTQQWSFVRYCDGSWVIRNVKTKRVIEVYNSNNSILAPLGQWDFSNAKNQRWFIEK